MTIMSACAVIAILELDAVMVAQILVSRPLIVGLIMGTLTGSINSGVFLGGTFELLSVCDLPVGGSLTWSSTIASGTSSLLAAGGTPLPLCFIGGIASGIFHCRLEAIERSWRASSGEAVALLAEQDIHFLGRALGSSILIHAFATFCVAILAVSTIDMISRYGWMAVPECIQSGASSMVYGAPLIGLSGILARGLKRA